MRSFIRLLLIFSLILMIPGQAKNLSGKKGVCMTIKHKKNWPDRVAKLNPHWHYTWGARLDQAPPPKVEFVPMIWGFWGADQGFQNTINQLTSARKSGHLTHLLGFNEPDQKRQANLPIHKALKAWPYLEKTGLRLGSPAAVHADRPWMQEFMREVKKRRLRVDFVTVHWYGGPNADSLINHLNKIHKLYRKPIWITEFAAADWNAKNIKDNKHGRWKTQQFMKEVLPKLDKLHFVERYAWYNAPQSHPALGNSALFKSDGSLTDLGKIYAAHKKN